MKDVVSQCQTAAPARTYAGTRASDGTTVVTVNGEALDARIDLRRGRAEGFDWGYPGTGAPARLAIAILADYFGDDAMARRYQAHFLRRVVRDLPAIGWSLTSADIEAVLPEGGY